MWDYVYRAQPPELDLHLFAGRALYRQPATLTVALLGYLQNPINPDHHATMNLNGTQVDDVTWDGITWQVVEMQYPARPAGCGDQHPRGTCPNDTGYGLRCGLHRLG